MTLRDSSAPALHNEPSVIPVLRLVHVRHDGRGPGIAKAPSPRATAAQCLRDGRVAAKLTIGRAATLYGVTARTWSSWEHGVLPKAGAA